MILQTMKRDEADLVLNLAAGLDTRPRRLAIPDSLQWVHVDLPDILKKYKADAMCTARSICKYESLHAIIPDSTARARIFGHCSGARRVLVVTDGLLVYLTSPQDSALARDLHGQATFKWWLTDVVGPWALELLRRIWGPLFYSAAFQFEPADGAGFFCKLNWRKPEFRSSRVEVPRLHRDAPATLAGRLMLLFALAALREEFYRLSGVSLLARYGSACKCPELETISKCFSVIPAMAGMTAFGYALVINTFHISSDQSRCCLSADLAAIDHVVGNV